MKDHINIDTSNLSSEELGKTIDEAMAKEDILLLDNSSCGYKAYLIPANLMEFEGLLNVLRFEPFFKLIRGKSMKDFFKDRK